MSEKIKILRIAERPTKKLPGKGLAASYLSKDIRFITNLCSPYPSRDDINIEINCKNCNEISFTFNKNQSPLTSEERKNKLFLFIRILMLIKANIKIIFLNNFNDYQIIHIHAIWYLPQFYWAMLNGKKRVYTLHGYDSVKIANSKFLRFLFWPVETVFCMTMDQISVFKKIFPNKKYIFASNGVDDKVFYSNKEYKERKNKVVCVGSLSWKKDYETILKSFSIFSKKFEDWRLEIYGIGGEEMKIKKLSNELSLEKKVSFCGTVDRVYLGNILRETKVYLINSIEEGLPKSLLEAMISGCACISSDAGECKNVLTTYGLVVRKKNILETSNALIMLAKDEKYAAKIAEDCQKRGRNYTWPKYINNHYKEYLRLLNR